MPAYQPVTRRQAQRFQESADRGDASVTLTAGVDSPVQQFRTALTAARTVTVNVAGALPGDWFQIARAGGGAFNLTVQDSVPTVIKVLAAAGFVEVSFDGVAWRLTNPP